MWGTLLILVVGFGAALRESPLPIPGEAPVQPPHAQSASIVPGIVPGAPASIPPLSFYLDPIVSRNVFDANPPSPAGQVSQEPEALIVASELPIKLISTSVASDPQWSTALIQSDDKTRGRLVRIGAQVEGGVVQDILRPHIGPDGTAVPARIVLDRAGGLEYLEEANKPPRVVKKKKKRKRRKRGKRRTRSKRKR